MQKLVALLKNLDIHLKSISDFFCIKLLRRIEIKIHFIRQFSTRHRNTIHTAFTTYYNIRLPVSALTFRIQLQNEYIYHIVSLEASSICSLSRHSLQWRHNGHDSVSNHQPHGCLLNRLFRRRSKKTSKLRVTGLCAGNSPGTGEFPAQIASYAEYVSIWWRHHVFQPVVRHTQ